MFKLASLCGIFESCTRSCSVAKDDKQDLSKPAPGSVGVSADTADVVSRGGEASGDPHVTRKKCIFCDVSKEKGFDIVWEVRRYDTPR